MTEEPVQNENADANPNPGDAPPPPEPKIELPPAIPPPLISLDSNLLGRCVSQVGKTYDGLSYAFTTLTAESKELEIIGDKLKDFKYLRNVSLAKNLLKSLKEIKDLPYLLTLNGSQNQVEEIDFMDDATKLMYLQTVNLSQNQIKEIPDIKLINLLNLNLTSNLINSALKFKGHETLIKLELRKNKLTSFKGIANMPKLQELFAAENEITSLEGLENLPSLVKLHVRKNPVFLFKFKILDC